MQAPAAALPQPALKGEQLLQALRSSWSHTRTCAEQLKAQVAATAEQHFDASPLEAAQQLLQSDILELVEALHGDASAADMLQQVGAS
jgi:hypothetical protein